MKHEIALHSTDVLKIRSFFKSMITSIQYVKLLTTAAV